MCSRTRIRLLLCCRIPHPNHPPCVRLSNVFCDRRRRRRCRFAVNTGGLHPNGTRGGGVTKPGPSHQCQGKHPMPPSPPTRRHIYLHLLSSDIHIFVMRTPCRITCPSTTMTPTKKKNHSPRIVRVSICHRNSSASTPPPPTHHPHNRTATDDTDNDVRRPNASSVPDLFSCSSFVIACFHIFCWFVVGCSRFTVHRSTISVLPFCAHTYIEGQSANCIHMRSCFPFVFLHHHTECMPNNQPTNRQQPQGNRVFRVRRCGHVS